MFEKEEVEEVKWIDLDEFRKWMNGEGEPMVPHPEEYKLLLERLT